MDKSTLKDHLAQPLQKKNEQFKIPVTFLTGYNGIFNVTNKNKKIISQYQSKMMISIKKPFHQEPTE